MTSFKLDRRTLLRGAGLAVALPMMDAMLTNRGLLHGRAQAAASPVRLVVYFYANGTRISKFFPTTPGPLGADMLSPYTKVFAPVAGKPDILPYLNIVSGLRHDNVLEGGHDRAAAVVGVSDGLSHNNSGALPRGPSLDQALAEKFGDATRFPSLVMGIGRHSKLQDAFVSWKDGGRAVQPTTDVKALFAQVFGTGAPDDAARIARLAARRKSVLDSLRQQATALEARLGGGDRARLGEHLTAIRELEKQVMTPGASSAACSADGVSGSTEHPLTLMCRLVTLAFKCDLTRYASIHTDRSGQASYPGSPGGDHDLSHNAPDNVIEQRTNIRLKFMADMMRDMAAIDDGGGATLLHNTIVMNTSEVADGRGHGHVNLPVVVGGRAGGKLAAGRYLAAGGKPLNDLFTTLLNHAGLDTPKWGTGANGPLTGF